MNFLAKNGRFLQLCGSNRVIAGIPGPVREPGPCRTGSFDDLGDEEEVQINDIRTRVSLKAAAEDSNPSTKVILVFNSISQKKSDPPSTVNRVGGGSKLKL